MQNTDLQPNSFSLLIEAAVRRRILLLDIYCYSQPAVICVLILFYFDFNVNLFLETSTKSSLVLLSILGIFILVQLIMLYGGGSIRPLSIIRLQHYRQLYNRLTISKTLQRWHLISVLRWFLPLTAFAIQMSIILAVLFIAFLEITERFGLKLVDRGLFKGFWEGGISDAILLFAFCLIVSLIIAGSSLYRTTRYNAISRLVILCCLISLYTCFIWSVLASLYDLGIYQKILTIVSWLILNVSSGAALRLLFLREGASTDKALQQVQKINRHIKGDVTLSSARTFSLVLLAVLYVALDVAIDQASQLGLLKSARQIFAIYYIAEHSIENTEESREDLPQSIHTVKILKQRSGMSIMGAGRVTIIRGVEVVQLTGERWTARAKLPKPLIGANKKQSKKTRLLAIASLSGIDVVPEESFYRLFNRVQHKLLADQKQVSIPVIGLPVVASNATWALTGLTLALLILIRSRVRRIFLDPEFAVEEPWLVLDGNTGIERLAAITWMFFVLLSPWVTHAALIVTLSVHISAGGAITSVFGDIFRTSVMLGLFVWSAKTALLLLMDLNYLRRLRLQYLTS